MHSRFSLGILVSVMLFGVVVSGCGKVQDALVNSDVTKTGTLARLVISPTTEAVSVSVGSTIQFEVQALDDTGKPIADLANLKWLVVGDIGSITSNGKFTASTDGNGKVRVVLGEVSAEVTVKVIDEKEKLVEPAKPTVPPTPETTPALTPTPTPATPETTPALTPTPTPATIEVKEITFLGLDKDKPVEVRLGTTLTIDVAVKDSTGKSFTSQNIEWLVEGVVGEFAEKGVFKPKSIGNGTVIVRLGKIEAKLQISVIPGDPSVQLASAREKWSAGDLQGAVDKYTEALTIDPNNGVANFGKGILEFGKIVEDPETRSIVKEIPALASIPGTLNELAPQKSAEGIVSTLSTYRPSMIVARGTTVTVSRVRDYIESVLLPRVNSVLKHLEIVEKDPNFQFMLPKAFARSAADLEVDLAEVYALDASLSNIKWFLASLAAYNFDFDDEKYQSPLLDPSFGVMTTNGLALNEEARLTLVRFADRGLKFYQYLQSEIDDQSDDIIPKIKADSSTENNAIQIIQKIKKSAEGESVVLGSATSAVKVNIGNFYKNPVQDWKEYARPEWANLKTVTKDDYPANYDFTLRGLFPEMTSYNLWNGYVDANSPPRNYTIYASVAIPEGYESYQVIRAELRRAGESSTLSRISSGGLSAGIKSISFSFLNNGQYQITVYLELDNIQGVTHELESRTQVTSNIVTISGGNAVINLQIPEPKRNTITGTLTIPEGYSTYKDATVVLQSRDYYGTRITYATLAAIAGKQTFALNNVVNGLYDVIANLEKDEIPGVSLVSEKDVASSSPITLSGADLQVDLVIPPAPPPQ